MAFYYQVKHGTMGQFLDSEMRYHIKIMIKNFVPINEIETFQQKNFKAALYKS